MRHDHDRYVDRLRDLQRRAARPDGLAALLRALVPEDGGFAVLADRTGRPRQAVPPGPPPGLDAAREHIERVLSGPPGGVSVSLPGAGGPGVGPDSGRGAGAPPGAPRTCRIARIARIVAIGEQDPGAVLIVGGAEPFTSEANRLIDDAAELVGLRWRLDELDRHRREVELAERSNREAVMHWLMSGDLRAARLVAGVIGPELPERLRVYVVESPAGKRDETMARCGAATHGRAWVIRCSVYARHTIVLAPTPKPSRPGGADPLERALRGLVTPSGEIRMGAGQPVALQESAVGYKQAFHALSAARSGSTGFADYSAREDLAELLGQSGAAWAEGLLAPLLRHRPERPRDPGGDELADTLRGWLTLYGHATTQLKVHRNTLSARLRHTERLLSCDLRMLSTQARLDLALRIHDRAGSPPRVIAPQTLDILLGSSGARRWARAQLAPLADRDPDPFTATLRCWLHHDARLDATATELGVSVPGVRKRLVRIEEILERSLLNVPSARYDLWLALRVRERYGA